MPTDATQPPGGFQIHQDRSTYVPTAKPMDFQAPGALTIAGTTLTPTAAQLNSVGAAVGTVAFDRLTKVAEVALAAVDTGGGIFAWANPEASSIIITSVLIYVTTVATGACSIDVGTTAVSATTASDNLLDGIDIHTATGAFTLADQAGANGLTRQVLAAGKWVTGSKDSGASAGIVGKALIYYIVP